VYYKINLEQLRELYMTAGAALHPALAETEPKPYERAQYRISTPTRVLFLCTHNSARSQMAEGILRNLSAGSVDVVSAGSNPADVHPYAVRALAKIDIDIRQQRSKHIEQYHGQSFDYIITVCDRVREACPIFPDDPERIHWSLPDPAAVDEQVRDAAFEQTAQELVSRIRFLLTLIKHQKGRPL
jgi:ArsR family transcriptional regulator, arsenate/arsenite/antimonite-responsive transcriptional repressor / arsenate reductase (thioredoxin)